MMPILIKHTCVPLVWVLLPVLVMVALFPILWLIFTRENSKFISHINMNNLLILYLILRQKNIDYSICQAISYNSDGIQRALITYDVACQWYKNFLARVEKSSSLVLPDNLEVVPAVGKFHLSAHKASCFSRFSLMFLKGAGHIDGEILETLWASFNKISPSARSMTLAHRQELYDDHMRDSNWKKLVGLGV
jgi:Kyakuja-Dileera-Zisupton transposase